MDSSKKGFRFPDDQVIYIRNLPLSTSLKEIEAVFRKIGGFVNASIVKQATKAIGFLNFSSRADAVKAISMMNSYPVQGVQLDLSLKSAHGSGSSNGSNFSASASSKKKATPSAAAEKPKRSREHLRANQDDVEDVEDRSDEYVFSSHEDEAEERQRNGDDDISFRDEIIHHYHEAASSSSSSPSSSGPFAVISPSQPPPHTIQHVSLPIPVPLPSKPTSSGSSVFSSSNPSPTAKMIESAFALFNQGLLPIESLQTILAQAAALSSAASVSSSAPPPVASPKSSSFSGSTAMASAPSPSPADSASAFKFPSHNALAASASSSASPSSSSSHFASQQQQQHSHTPRAILVIDGHYCTKAFEKHKLLHAVNWKQLVDFLQSTLNVAFHTRKFFFDSITGPDDPKVSSLYRQLSLGAPAGPGFQTKPEGEHSYKNKTVHIGGRTITFPVQKGVDCSIATRLLVYAHYPQENPDSVETVVLLSGDSDFLEALRHIRRTLFKNVILVGFSDNSVSVDIQQLASRVIFLDQPENYVHFCTVKPSLPPPALPFASNVSAPVAPPSVASKSATKASAPLQVTSTVPAVAAPLNQKDKEKQKEKDEIAKAVAIRAKEVEKRLREKAGKKEEREREKANMLKAQERLTKQEEKLKQKEEKNGKEKAPAAAYDYKEEMGSIEEAIKSMKKTRLPTPFNRFEDLADVCEVFWAGKSCGTMCKKRDHLWAPATSIVEGRREVGRVCRIFMKNGECLNRDCKLLHLHPDELHAASFSSKLRAPNAPSITEPVVCLRQVFGACRLDAAHCGRLHVHWNAVQERACHLFMEHAHRLKQDMKKPNAHPMDESVGKQGTFCPDFWFAHGCEHGDQCSLPHVYMATMPGQEQNGCLGRICPFVEAQEQCPLGAVECPFAHFSPKHVHKTESVESLTANCLCPFFCRPSHICKANKQCAYIHVNFEKCEKRIKFEASRDGTVPISAAAAAAIGASSSASSSAAAISRKEPLDQKAQEQFAEESEHEEELARVSASSSAATSPSLHPMSSSEEESESEKKSTVRRRKRSEQQIVSLDDEIFLETEEEEEEENEDDEDVDLDEKHARRDDQDLLTFDEDDNDLNPSTFQRQSGPNQEDLLRFDDIWTPSANTPTLSGSGSGSASVSVSSSPVLIGRLPLTASMASSLLSDPFDLSPFSHEHQKDVQGQSEAEELEESVDDLLVENLNLAEEDL